MRITNAMTTNRLLLNINRNARSAERFMMQLTSGKVIQNPSDNPIIASRALRFRTNVSEVAQFQRNATQANSWMELTEEALNNTTNIMTNINSMLVQGATGTFTIAQRQTIVTEIQMLFQQINSAEMNATFAGRYLFSGFRTDRPPIITRDNIFPPDGNEFYCITKSVNRNDIESLGVMSWRDNSTVPPTLVKMASPEFIANHPELPWTATATPASVHKIKLPYVHTDERRVDTPDIPGFTINRIYRDNTDGENPYLLSGPGIINFIPETGELIIHPDDLALFEGGLEVHYDVFGVLEGELNPTIFFNTIHTRPDGDTFFNAESQEIRFELGTNVNLPINSQARDAYPWQFFSDLQSLYNFVLSAGIDSDATPEEAVQQESFFREALYQKFTNMMSAMERHMQHTSTEFTTLGSRMNRVELISNRLDENYDTFTNLMSENENIDFIEVMLRFNAAEAIFQAAMQIGARIAQVSIVNFI